MSKFHLAERLTGGGGLRRWFGQCLTSAGYDLSPSHGGLAGPHP